MAFGIGTSAGASFVTASVAAKVYDPVFDTPMDAAFIWNLLPSWYRTFMEDKKSIESLWAGLIQAGAAELLRLWHTDYAKSLTTVPIFSARKWLRFEFLTSLSFTADPGLITVGSENTFSYDPTLDALAGVWTARAGLDKAAQALRGKVTEKSSLSWDVTVSYAIADIKSAAFFGYLNSEETSLKNALLVGMSGDPLTSNAAHPTIAHYDSSGRSVVSVGAYILSANTAYRFACVYLARTQTASLDVYEKARLRVSSSAGQTGEELGSVVTATLQDTTVDFLALGVSVGDVLKPGTETLFPEYTVTAVQAHQIMVSPAALPNDTESFAYSIYGEQKVTSLVLNIGSDAEDPAFSVDQFGTVILDTRTVSATLVNPPGDANRRVLTGTTTAWSFLDPAFQELLLTVPRLQDTVLSPTFFLEEGTDYKVEAALGSGSVFLFQEPPTQALWAEYAGLDEGHLREGFGQNVGLVELASESYKSKIRGLFYAYFQGPTPAAIRTGVHLLLGLPIANAAGVVEALDTEWSGLYGKLTISGVDYYYPLSVGTSLQVGDSVEQFQPLSDGVELLDYLNSPYWWLGLSSFNEMQKYHSFAVRVNLDAFAVSSFELAAQFVSQVKPTWKDVYFFAFKDVNDTVAMDDRLAFVVGLNVWDVIGDIPEPRYDSRDYDGVTPDWAYDQGRRDWTSTTPTMLVGMQRLSGLLTLTNGDTQAFGTDTVFTAELGINGALPKYIAIARQLEGTQGGTTTGINQLTDGSGGNSFAPMAPGWIIEVTGEGRFEVQSVPNGNLVIVDRSFSNTTTTATWSAEGPASTWGTVTIVDTNTDLFFQAPYPGPDGDYAYFLMDPFYRDIHYDYFEEASPDERLTLCATTSVGCKEQLLTGRVHFVASLNYVEGYGTSFISELGLGAVSNVYISCGDGCWYEVIYVETDTSLFISALAQRTSPDEGEPSFKATGILTGTFSFTHGSATVIASTSQTGLISPTDWLQIVPTRNLSDPIGSTPVVQVSAVSGTTVTLTAPYSGLSASSVKVNLRGGTTGAFSDDPGVVKFVTLPTSQTSEQEIALTDWYGQGDGYHQCVTEAEPNAGIWGGGTWNGGTWS